MTSVVSDAIYYLANFGKVMNQTSMLIVAFVAFAIFVIGFTLGRSKLLLSILSIYTAYFLEVNFRYIDSIQNISGTLPYYYLHIGLFVILFASVFYVFSRSVLKNRITLKDASLVVIIILSFINAGLFLSVLSSYLPRIGEQIIPDAAMSFFGSKNALFIWALLSLIVIYFMKGKKETSTISKLK